MMRLRVAGGFDHVGAALPGELFDERGPTELFNEQGDVDCADVGAQHASVVRTSSKATRQRSVPTWWCTSLGPRTRTDRR